jgi:hypothetical protein
MATIMVRVPKRLGLSDDQVTKLKQKFESLLVETMRTEATGTLAAAVKELVDPKVMASPKIVIEE